MSANPDREPTAADITLRRITSADLDEVHALETFSYAFPWTKGNFRDCLTPGYENWLLIQDGKAVGYGILYFGVCEAHILNICVHPEYRRRQFGKHILLHLLARADSGGVQQVILEVRPSNQAALRLYTAEGFEQIGRRPGYYPDRNGREDALVLALSLEPRLQLQDDDA